MSIITPVHNGGRYLGETISAIQAQTFSDWELLVVDDGSTDDSVLVARTAAEKDARVRCLANRFARGPAGARNTALADSRGRFIAFCDSDDVWLPAKLQAQVNLMLSTGAPVCFTSYYKMREDGTRTTRLVAARSMVTYRDILRSNFIGCSTAMYDTAKCGKVPMPDLAKRQDYGLWLRILADGHVAAGLTEPLVHYRVRSDSVSGNKLLAAAYHWKVLTVCTRESFFSRVLLFVQYAAFGINKARI